MRIETIPVGAFVVNCYVAWGAERQALVIDPGADADSIAKVIREHSLSVAAYLLTHGHTDHVGGLASIHKLFPAPVAIHPDDAAWAFSRVNELPPYYPSPEKPDAEFRTLDDGQTWRDADLAYSVITTPGHSPGGVCFYFPDEEVLFSGDTLFQSSVGRTDLRGGSGRVLAESLKKLALLPSSTRVFPGHGSATTIGQEKRTNFFFRGT